MATSPTKRRPAGRPTKLTPDVADTIVAAIRAGNYVETAAAYAGVNRATVFRWLKEADQPGAGRSLVEFRDAVQRARAESEIRVVGQIQRVIMGGQVLKEITRTMPDGATETEKTYAAPDGRVALEFMSRAYPDRWARRSALEVTGAGGGPVQVEHAHVIAGLAERLHAALGGGDVVAGEVVDEG